MSQLGQSIKVRVIFSVKRFKIRDIKPSAHWFYQSAGVSPGVSSSSQSLVRLSPTIKITGYGCYGILMFNPFRIADGDDLFSIHIQPLRDCFSPLSESQILTDDTDFADCSTLRGCCSLECSDNLPLRVYEHWGCRYENISWRISSPRIHPWVYQE